MSLKNICFQNIVNQIKQLPPVLQEEVIGYSFENIKQQIKKELLEEMKKDSEIVINDLTDIILSSKTSGKDWKRPEYTKNIDDNLYYNFVNISEMIVNKYYQKIINQHDNLEESDY